MPSSRLLGMLRVLVLLGAGLGAGCSGDSSADAPPVALAELAFQETTVGVPYAVTFTATTGTPPLQFSVAELPPGFAFYRSTGQLKGPATAAGSYVLSVQVRDARGSSATKDYPLRVYAAPSLRATTLASATQGTPYAVPFEVEGGKPPLRWVLTAGALPAGLALGEDGSLAGTPQAAGSYALTVRVTDAHGAQAEQTFGLEVRAGSGPPPATSLAFSAANWNLEWFGDTGQGPSDEALQLRNVQQVIATTDADFWGLQEVVDSAQFDALKRQLPGYDGFIANDASVVSGASYYGATDQKLAVLFRSDVVRVLDKRLILTSSAYAFGGRPPLQLKLRVTRSGRGADLTVIVLHMKAYADSESYSRRKSAASALKSYLDTQSATTPVLVLGDWNDDVDVSIVRDSSSGTYLPTPYQGFVDNAASYTFATRPLALAGQSSTVKATNTEFIDHQLLGGKLATSLVKDSTQVLHPDTYISRYGVTTTDHYPVLSRFAFSASP
jgi:endonuclease/exonuclease/phosphatase family metal-dependent hydrolase